jgi:pyocin large subunit-like protein
MWRNRPKDKRPTFYSRLLGYLILVALIFEAFVYACNSSSTQNTSSQNQQPPASSLSQTPSKISRPHVGFASRQKLVDHFKKHGQEFGAISMEEYLRQAQELRDRAAGGNVLETIRSDGVISRFDRGSGAFIAFHPDGVIRTFFKPNDGEAYFWRQSRRKN